MFITFEGIDYSGKSTQIKLLADRLAKNNYRVQVLREPGGTEIGETIRQLLLDKKNTRMTAASELFLFSASRSQLVEEVINPALKSGIIVICDRFFDSTTAYQGFGREISIDVIDAINKYATNGLLPEQTFFIDIPVEEIDKRMKFANTSKDRMESNNTDFYNRVREGYLQLAKNNSRFKVLNGLLTIEELHELIWSTIINKIKEKKS